MHRYRAYELLLSCCIELPELKPADGDAEADIVVEYGEVDFLPVDRDEWGYGFRAEPGRACHSLAKIGDFLIEGGRHITVAPAEGAEDRVLRLSILGPSMSVALTQRGTLVIHGSAVEIGGRAYAFVGMHGQGKSTMVTAMVRRGHRLITDDVLAIDIVDGRPSVRPSYSQIKLWPDSAENLVDPGRELHALHPELEKLGLRQVEIADGRHWPLGGIYELNRGETLETRTCGPAEAFPVLMGNWYGGRYPNDRQLLLPPDVLMGQLSALINAAPVSKLVRPFDLSRIDQVCSLIERDVRASTGA